MSSNFEDTFRADRDIVRRNILLDWRKLVLPTAYSRHPSDLITALVVAHKCLDAWLVTLKYQGQTSSQRIWCAQRDIPNYHLLREASELRNRVAHILRSPVIRVEILDALNAYAQALRHLGVPVPWDINHFPESEWDAA